MGGRGENLYILPASGGRIRSKVIKCGTYGVANQWEWVRGVTRFKLIRRLQRRILWRRCVGKGGWVCCCLGGWFMKLEVKNKREIFLMSFTSLEK